eukprot:6171941-Pleurochrysis_carterae.AAC.1
MDQQREGSRFHKLPSTSRRLEVRHSGSKSVKTANCVLATGLHCEVAPGFAAGLRGTISRRNRTIQTHQRKVESWRQVGTHYSTMTKTRKVRIRQKSLEMQRKKVIQTLTEAVESTGGHDGDMLIQTSQGTCAEKGRASERRRRRESSRPQAERESARTGVLVAVSRIQEKRNRSRM